MQVGEYYKFIKEKTPFKVIANLGKGEFRIAFGTDDFGLLTPGHLKDITKKKNMRKLTQLEIKLFTLGSRYEKI